MLLFFFFVVFFFFLGGGGEKLCWGPCFVVWILASFLLAEEESLLLELCYGCL